MSNLQTIEIGREIIPADPGIIQVRRSKGSRETGKLTMEDASYVLSQVEQEATLTGKARQDLLDRLIEESNEPTNLRMRRKATMSMGSWRNALLIALPLYSGFRRSDVIKMKWKDLVYKNSAQEMAVHEKVIVFKEQKTKNRRAIPISAELGYFIIRLFNDMKPRDLNTWVFVSPMDRTKHITNTAMTLIINDSFSRFGVYDKDGTVSPHTLRKTYSYFMWEALGGDFEALIKMKMLLGHSNIEYTITYLGIRDSEVIPAHNALSFRGKGIRTPARYQ